MKKFVLVPLIWFPMPYNKLLNHVQMRCSRCHGTLGFWGGVGTPTCLLFHGLKLHWPCDKMSGAGNIWVMSCAEGMVALNIAWRICSLVTVLTAHLDCVLYAGACKLTALVLNHVQVAGPFTVCICVVEAITMGDITAPFGGVDATIGSSGHATINSWSPSSAFIGVSSSWIIKSFGYSTIHAEPELHGHVVSCHHHWFQICLNLCETIHCCLQLVCCLVSECYFSVIQGFDDCISGCDNFERCTSGWKIHCQILILLVFSWWRPDDCSNVPGRCLSTTHPLCALPMFCTMMGINILEPCTSLVPTDVPQNQTVHG